MLYRLPVNEGDLLQRWLTNMYVSENFKVSYRMTICSDHFESDCFSDVNNKRLIKRGSVPTIFHWAKCVACRAEKTPKSNLMFYKYVLFIYEIVLYSFVSQIAQCYN